MRAGVRACVASACFVFVLCALGCTMRTSQVVPALDVLDDPQVPFSIRILEELNDGQHLVVAGEVVPRTNWPVRNVALRLSAIHAGRVVNTSRHALVDPSANQQDSLLSSGKAVKFSISMPLSTATDYQLELEWGEGVTPQPEQQQEAPLLIQSQRVIREEICTGQEVKCPARHILVAQIVNRSTKGLKNVVLSLKLRVGVDLSSNDNQDKRLVPLAGVMLSPGVVQPLRLVLEELATLQAQSPNAGQAEATLAVESWEYNE